MRTISREFPYYRVHLYGLRLFYLNKSICIMRKKNARECSTDIIRMLSGYAQNLHQRTEPDEHVFLNVHTLNRDGSNTDGFGKFFGFQCKEYAEHQTYTSFGKIRPSHSSTRS